MNTGNQREHVLDDLKAYLDGQLGPAQRLAVRLHLARCPLCRKEMTTMEQIGTNLRESETGGLDAALRARILAAIPAEEEKTEDRRQKTGDSKSAARGWRRGLVLASGGLAVASLAIVFYASRNMGRRSASMTDTAASSASGPVALNSTAKTAGEDTAKEAVPQAVAPAAPLESDKDMTVAQNKNPMQSRAAANASAASLSAPMSNPGGGATPTYAAPGASANATTAGQAVASPPPAVSRTKADEMAHSVTETYTDAGEAAEGPRKQQNQHSAAANASRKTPDREVAAGKPARSGDAALTVRVDETTSAAMRVVQIAQSVKGYVIHDQRATNADASQTATLTLQVPVTQITSVVSQIRSMGTLETQTAEPKVALPQDSDARVSREQRNGLARDRHAANILARPRAAKRKTTLPPPSLTTIRVTLTEKARTKP